jgi:hypothetical protein
LISPSDLGRSPTPDGVLSIQEETVSFSRGGFFSLSFSRRRKKNASTVRKWTSDSDGLWFVKKKGSAELESDPDAERLVKKPLIDSRRALLANSIERRDTSVAERRF